MHIAILPEEFCRRVLRPIFANIYKLVEDTFSSKAPRMLPRPFRELELYRLRVREFHRMFWKL